MSKPGTLAYNRDTILARAVGPLEGMEAGPAYDALKPRVRAATGKVLDAIVETIGDVELFDDQQAFLTKTLSHIAGVVSGSLTRMELTDEDIERTIVAARAKVQEGALARLQALLPRHEEDLN